MKKTIVPALSVAVAAAISMHAILWAQQSGSNVNVLPSYPIGNTFPIPLDPVTHLPIATTTPADNVKGDNFLQRQVEPTIASSTFNSDHLVAAYNDYRLVDFANDTEVAGAAGQRWIGYSRSYDRGKHWYGAMVPGFPGSTSAADRLSPLYGLTAGSDPTLATTPGGHFYLSGLFFSPDGISKIAVMHLRDVPTLEGGDSIKPGKISILDRSSADRGRFDDKPSIATDIARGTTRPDVCGPVYAAYTVFIRDSVGSTPFLSRIGFTRSKQGDCGDEFEERRLLSGNYLHNQAAAVAVDPASGRIYVVWRHVFQPGGDGFPDSILIVTSNDGGETFTAPAPLTGADFAPFDQISIDSNTDPNHMSFRSSAFPAIAVDGSGNVYVAIQERVAFGPPAPAGYNEPRVVIRSRRPGTAGWNKGFVEANPVPGGQQVMPSLTFSAGVLRAMWYDFRRPESFPNDTAWGLPSTCDNAGHCYISGLDRRMETRIAQLAVNNLAGLAFAPSKPVTKYDSKTFAGQPAGNRPNLPLYVGGTTAFAGDYLTAAVGSPFVANPPGSNPPFRWATQTTDITALPTLTAWTDSREVVYPMGASGHPELSVANINAWRSYGPAGTGLASCINPGSRNQNVYFSEVKPGVIAGSPATSRQLVDGGGLPFERAFPFYVQNTTYRKKFFRVSFQQDSTAVKGSFIQGAAKTTTQPPAPFDVTIGPISTVSKTIYAYCASCTTANAFGRFSIKVDEIQSIGGSIVSGGLTTQLRFNSDPTAPFVANDLLANQEIHTVSFSTADWASADWASADWASADWASADWASADWASADWASADWASADWASADWASADWASMSPVGDLVSTASNAGNNASSYSVAVNINPALAAQLKARGYLAGLFITRSYNAANSFTGCALQPIPLEQIISVIPLDLTNLQTTVLDTAAFAAVPSTNSTLAVGNSSGSAQIQPDNVFVFVRLFGKRNGGTPPPPLPAADQATLIANTTTTIAPQAGNTVAGKQTATVTLSNLSQVYTGSPLTPTATTNPPGLLVVFSGAPQTNVGTYAVLATINDPIFQGSATGTFFITPAASTTTVTCPASVPYNGFAQTPCSASATGVGGLSQPLVVSYSNNTNAGTATASATFTGDGNHTGSSNSKTFSIAKVPVTATAGSGSSTYDGFPHSPSACVVSGAYTGDLSCANNPASVGPTAGTTIITPVVSGTTVGNFIITPINGSFTIAKATASVTITPYDVIYDGHPHTASGTATGVNGENLSGLLNLSGTTHTLVGDYPNDPWSFAGSVNYNSAAGTVHDRIRALTTPVTVGVADAGNCYPFMCNDSGAGTGPSIHYQQVYAASAFTGRSQIDSLTFFQVFSTQFGGTTAVLSGNYQVSLSTTSRSVNGLSTNLASNIGGDNRVVFNGNLGGVSTSPSFTIPASVPFIYDPAAGNLLLDIVVTDQTVLPNGSGNGYNDADTTGTSTTRAYAFVGNATGPVDVTGLVTRFNVSSPTVTVGVANDLNCYPFMCNDTGTNVGPSIHYQQVYSASKFTGITPINSLTFFQSTVSGTTTVLNGTYRISLSTTTKGVNGLSSTVAENIGADNTQIFSGNLGGTSATPSFTIAAAVPFVYNPAAGNLLVDIVVTNQTALANGAGNGYLDADFSATATTRAYAFLANGIGFVDTTGLVTRFNK